MRTVIHGIAWFPSITKERLLNLMQLQCSASRSAYQAQQKSLKNNDIRKYVKQNFMQSLNQRYINDACSNASQISKSHVIFGGKKLWKDLVNGKISKGKWHNKRNNQLYSRGDRSQQGNPNIRIQGNRIYINDPNNRGKWLEGSIFIPKKFSINQDCYDVRILWRNNRFEIKIGYEQEIPDSISQIPGSIGIDINPDGVALAETNGHGNLLKHQYLAEPRIQFAREDKRNYDIYQLAKEAIEQAKQAGKSIIIENLKFIRKNKGKIFNRMASNFCYKKIAEAIVRRAEKEGIEVIQVNPAFTSILGLLKYKEMYSLNRHTSAALVIGRRGMGIKERQVFGASAEEKVKKDGSEKSVVNLEGRGTRIALSQKSWSWLQDQFLEPTTAGLTAPTLDRRLAAQMSSEGENPSCESQFTTGRTGLKQCGVKGPHANLNGNICQVC